jgi:hypothetical protein
LKDIQQTFEEGMDSLCTMGKLFTGAETRIYDHLSGRKSTAKSLRLERHTCQNHPHFIDQQDQFTEQQKQWRNSQKATEEEKSSALHHNCEQPQASPAQNKLLDDTLVSSNKIHGKTDITCMDVHQPRAEASSTPSNDFKHQLSVKKALSMDTLVIRNLGEMRCKVTSLKRTLGCIAAIG